WIIKHLLMLHDFLRTPQVLVFFFSSRRRHTRFSRDWSSDVCFPISISRNVGAVHRYLTRITTNPLYNRARNQLKGLLQRAPAVEELAIKVEESVKNLLVPGTLFEELGFRYFGPVDGHDLDALLSTLSSVKSMTGPRLVHVVTKKGKGFPLAEQNPVLWHGASPFDKLSGQMAQKGGLPAY